MKILESMTDKPAGAATLPVAGIFPAITAGLADGNDLETLLARFLVPLLRLVGAQAGAVRTLTDDGQRMQLVGAVGLPPDVLAVEQLMDRHCGFCGAAADTDTMTWGTDLRPCAQRCAADYFGRRCQRVLAVPLRHRDTVLGIYTLFFDAGTALGADIEAVLRSISELLGLALHYAKLERENLRASVMNERQLLAGEVHDAVAQTLAYMKMRLPLLQDAMAAARRRALDEVLRRREACRRRGPCQPARDPHPLSHAHGSAGPAVCVARDRSGIPRPHRHRA